MIEQDDDAKRACDSQGRFDLLGLMSWGIWAESTGYNDWTLENVIIWIGKFPEQVTED